MTKRKVTDLLPTEAILISSDADLKVLEEFEKADARWNSGDKATSKKKGYFSYPVYFKNDGILGLRWTADTGEFITTYPATDFIPTEADDVEVYKFDRALKLLKDLADLQNGAPLQQHRTEWEQTMDEVYTFLNQHETRNTPNQ